MEENKNHRKVIIIGSGPAGLTAAIYAGRANLNPLVLEGNQPGGQLTITTEIENFPGFDNGIQGPELMDIMRKQANKFNAETLFSTVEKVDLSKRPFKIFTEDKEYLCDSLIVATGATAKFLNVPGEAEYMGYGVSACATCDGFFFKNQHVAIVGGGDTALEEATYLTHHASLVTVIHRRNELRASKAMIAKAKNNPKINFVWDSVVTKVNGTNINGIKKLTSVTLKNVKSNIESDFKCDGLFVAIGHQPNTKIFEGILDMDAVGYLIIKPFSTQTNIEGVFAAGDVADPKYRQAVSAAGSGCMAAIDVERFLAQ